MNTRTEYNRIEKATRLGKVLKECYGDYKVEYNMGDNGLTYTYFYLDNGCGVVVNIVRDEYFDKEMIDIGEFVISQEKRFRYNYLGYQPKEEYLEILHNIK